MSLKEVPPGPCWFCPLLQETLRPSWGSGVWGLASGLCSHSGTSSHVQTKAWFWMSSSITSPQMWWQRPHFFSAKQPLISLLSQWHCYSGYFVLIGSQIHDPPCLDLSLSPLFPKSSILQHSKVLSSILWWNSILLYGPHFLYLLLVGVHESCHSHWCLLFKHYISIIYDGINYCHLRRCIVRSCGCNLYFSNG